MTAESPAAGAESVGEAHDSLAAGSPPEAARAGVSGQSGGAVSGVEALTAPPCRDCHGRGEIGDHRNHSGEWVMLSASSIERVGEQQREPVGWPHVVVYGTGLPTLPVRLRADESDPLTAHAQQTRWQPDGRLILTSTGKALGVMDSAVLAGLVCEAHNEALERKAL